MRLAIGAILILLLAGCAARQPIQPPQQFAQPTTGMWQSCQEVVKADSETDGFQHFVCVDKAGRKWEVDTRMEPSK